MDDPTLVPYEMIRPGFWDFGSPHNGSGWATRIRLSGSWRGRQRMLDWTADVLQLLSAYAGT